MNIIVFLGPSLPIEEARQVLDATYLPPAAQADILSAVTRYKPQAIGLIDGVFSQSLSVWHKEILYALEQGISVFGASSMGALRALETAEFGMTGVGEVYRMYVSGEIADDDEVAVAHGMSETGYRKMSEPMVNIRATLARALREGVIESSTHDLLIRLAKDTFYPERTFPKLFTDALRAGVSAEIVDAVQQFVASKYLDIKKQDAIELLQVLARLTPKTCRHNANFQLTRSHLFETLYNRDRSVQHDGVDIPLSSIATYASLHFSDFLDLNSAALNRELVLVLAELLDVQVEPADVDEEIERFRVRWNLLAAGALDEWRECNHLSDIEFQDLMKKQTLCRKLQRWLVTRKYLERTTKTVLDELRLKNRYEEAAQGAAQIEQILRDHFPGYEEYKQTDLVPDLMREHLRETPCRIDVHYSRWSEEAGYKDLFDLRFELLRTRLARRFLDNLTLEVKGALAMTESGEEERQKAG